MTKVYASKPTEDRATRNCLDPWFYAMITSDSAVKPCCLRAPVGNLSEGHFAAIMNGSAIKEVRRQLVNGELDGPCSFCPLKPLIGVQEFRLRLQFELAEASHRVLAVDPSPAVRE